MENINSSNRYHVRDAQCSNSFITLDGNKNQMADNFHKAARLQHFHIDVHCTLYIHICYIEMERYNTMGRKTRQSTTEICWKFVELYVHYCQMGKPKVNAKHGNPKKRPQLKLVGQSNSKRKTKQNKTKMKLFKAPKRLKNSYKN